MNTPNKLTLLRVVLSPVFMAFFVADNFWMKVVALALFSLAALTDLADGYYARKFGIITGFGRFMDPLADKILVSSALIAFIALRYVSPLPVMLIIGREFIITGLRLLAAYRGVVISPSWWAKVKTFLQMSVVGIILAFATLIAAYQHYQMPTETLARFEYQFWFNVMIWATAVVTVWTGVDYLIKYYYMVKTVLK